MTRASASVSHSGTAVLYPARVTLILQAQHLDLLLQRRALTAIAEHQQMRTNIARPGLQQQIVALDLDQTADREDQRTAPARPLGAAGGQHLRTHRGRPHTVGDDLLVAVIDLRRDIAAHDNHAIKAGIGLVAGLGAMHGADTDGAKPAQSGSMGGQQLSGLGALGMHDIGLQIPQGLTQLPPEQRVAAAASHGDGVKLHTGGDALAVTGIGQHMHLMLIGQRTGEIQRVPLHAAPGATGRAQHIDHSHIISSRQSSSSMIKPATLMG